MLKPTKIALGVGVAGVVAGGLGASTTGWRRVAWLWIAASCVVASAAYVANRPAWLGKRRGVLTWRSLPVLPYLLAFRIACALMRWWRGDDAPVEVAEGLQVAGRIERRHVADPEATLILDLVAEFPEPRALRTLPGYRQLAVLDGSHPPDVDACLRLVAEAAAWPGPVLVHCDSGRGRAPTVAAAVLIARGLAADVAAALAMQRACRPVIAPTRSDIAFLARLTPALDPPPSPRRRP